MSKNKNLRFARCRACKLWVCCIVKYNWWVLMCIFYYSYLKTLIIREKQELHEQFIIDLLLFIVIILY